MPNHAPVLARSEALAAELYRQFQDLRALAFWPYAPGGGLLIQFPFQFLW